DVSIKAGERVLLPAVRGAARDTLIIADGFSCREQIAQTTNRRALHLAQVLQMALRGDTGSTPYPESRYMTKPAEFSRVQRVALLACVSALGALLWLKISKARDKR
ncbi:MAG: hypothetical protein WCF84_11575, partial [Anaerolineae bacterium]